MLMPKRVKYRREHRGKMRGRAKGGSLVDADSSDTFGSNSLQTKKEKALSSKTQSSVVSFLVNTFRLFKQDLKMHFKTV